MWPQRVSRFELWTRLEPILRQRPLGDEQLVAWLAEKHSPELERSTVQEEATGEAGPGHPPSFAGLCPSTRERTENGTSLCTPVGLINLLTLVAPTTNPWQARAETRFFRPHDPSTPASSRAARPSLLLLLPPPATGEATDRPTDSPTPPSQPWFATGLVLLSRIRRERSKQEQGYSSSKRS